MIIIIIIIITKNKCKRTDYEDMRVAADCDFVFFFGIFLATTKESERQPRCFYLLKNNHSNKKITTMMMIKPLTSSWP